MCAGLKNQCDEIPWIKNRMVAMSKSRKYLQHEWFIFPIELCAFKHNVYEIQTPGDSERTGKPGMLQSMGSNRVGQDLETEQPQEDMKYNESFFQMDLHLNTLMTPSSTYPLFLGPGIEVQGARGSQDSQFLAIPQLHSGGNW